MSGPQPPPTRPWFRLASMVRPADPRPPAVPPPSTTTSAPPPSPKKPPASPTSAKADIPKDSTTNTPPPADPRSPVVAARSPKPVMSPGVPRLPTGVPQTTTSTEGSNFIESSSTSAPTPLLPPLPVPSQKLTLPAVADQETKIMDRTGTSSIPTPPPIPPQSPYKPKSSMAPPPSPLLLPPPQISPMNNEPRMIPPEAEQKAVLVKEETIPATTPATYPASARQTSSLQHLVNNNAAARRTNGAATAAHPHPDNYKEGEAEKRITTINKQSPKLNNKKKLESDQEVGMKVITIAGENRGAIMELVRSPPPPPASGKSVSRHNNKLVMSENERESSSSGKEAGIGQYSMSSKEKSNSSSASIPMTAFMNSNVQGVNNSILFNAQCTHQNPGVHVSLSRKPSSNIKSKVHNVKGTHSDKN